MNNILLAFGVTLLAGLATGLGSAIAFFAKRTNFRFLSIATGFSAGVMLYVSFLEIMPEALESLEGVYGEKGGHWATALAFFGGIAVIGLIDLLIPSASNPHMIHSEKETLPLHDPSAPQPPEVLEARAEAAEEPGAPGHKHLMRMGVFTALAIAIHNFPEGLATFLAVLHDPAIGIVIGIAIALHNIPEGISVSVPIYYATGDRMKAFKYSVLSGLAEPLGAIVGYAILRMFWGGDDGALPENIMGIMFAGVAGIMVYISLDELLPTSRAYGKGHDSLIGLLLGMLVMALSLLLML